MASPGEDHEMEAKNGAEQCEERLGNLKPEPQVRNPKVLLTATSSRVPR